MDGRYVQVNHFFKKCLDQTILSFIFTIVCCTPTSNDFSQEEEKLSDKKLFCLKKYKSVKQQFSFWFFLIFSRAPFFRIWKKVDYDSLKVTLMLWQPFPCFFLFLFDFCSTCCMSGGE